MISRDLKELRPETRAKVEAWLVECKTLIAQPVIVTCTFRDQSEQDAEWARGRYDLATVNRLRMQVGRPPITEAQNRKVTWTKRSKHTERVAVDFCVGKADPYDTKMDIDKDGIADYTEVGECAKRHGLQWGIFLASGAHADLCHVQDNQKYEKGGTA